MELCKPDLQLAFAHFSNHICGGCDSCTLIWLDSKSIYFYHHNDVFIQFMLILHVFSAQISYTSHPADTMVHFSTYNHRNETEPIVISQLRLIVPLNFSPADTFDVYWYVLMPFNSAADCGPQTMSLTYCSTNKIRRSCAIWIMEWAKLSLHAEPHREMWKSKYVRKTRQRDSVRTIWHYWHYITHFINFSKLTTPHTEWSKPTIFYSKHLEKVVFFSLYPAICCVVPFQVSFHFVAVFYW